MANRHALLVDLRRLPERRAAVAMANERLPGGRRITWATRVTMPATSSPARSAYDHGSKVTLAVDAMTDLHADAHRHSFEKIFPRLGELATTDDMVFRSHRVPLFVMQRIAPHLITMQSRRLQEPSGFALPRLRPRQLRHRHV